MPFTIANDPHLIRITFTGVFTDEDLRGLTEAMTAIEEASTPVAPRITDVTGVTQLKIAYPDVHALAQKRRATTFPNTFKSAIVVGGPVQLGMARMFQTLNDNPQITIEIFSDEAAAMAWLRS